jgi:hypothetical protein
MTRRRRWTSAKITKVGGETFPSRAEARRWQELRFLEAAGEISELSRDPRFALEVNGCGIGRYTGDFRYIDKSGAVVVEEVKGRESRDFRLRWKLAQALNPEIKFILLKV